MRRVYLSDFPEILSWFVKRKMEKPPMWAFSDEGFIEPNVAAGFLYLTNSGVAHIDCYITNPDVDKNIRTIALKEITKRILITAHHQHDVQMILCNTKLPVIEEIAHTFNFRSDGKNSMYSKAL